MCPIWLQDAGNTGAVLGPTQMKPKLLRVGAAPAVAAWRLQLPVQAGFFQDGLSQSAPSPCSRPLCSMLARCFILVVCSSTSMFNH